MKKYLFFIAMAICLAGTVTSCGDKNEQAISKYEKLIEKANKESDPIKKAIILDDAAKAVKDLKEEDLTNEQKERILKAASSIGFSDMNFE